MPYFSDWSQRNFKSPFFSFFFKADLASPYTSYRDLQGFQGHIGGSDVPKILCLQHPGIVANWTDFKPPFQNKVQGSLSYVFFLQPFI